MSHNQPEPVALRGYLPSLDGWRAIAILIVLFVHSRDALIRSYGAPMLRLAPHLELWGPFGVDLFFAISGLLITSRLLAEESRTGTISLGNFYRRRAFRILPPSLVYLATILALGSLHTIAFSFHSWLAALLFYVNYTTHPMWFTGHFWSLAVEEHFYAFWPALLLFVPRRCRLNTGLALCAAILLWRLLNFKFAAIGNSMGSPYFEHQGRSDFQLDGILWGASVALLYQRFAHTRWLQRILTLPVAATLFPLALLSLNLPGNWKLLQAMLLFRNIALPLVLLTTVLNCRGMVKAIFEHPALKMIGRLSYSLYLWQQLFLVWGVGSWATVAWPQRYPFNLCCAVTCAVLSFYLIEKPFIRLGHRRRSTHPLAQPLQLPERHSQLAA